MLCLYVPNTVECREHIAHPSDNLVYIFVASASFLFWLVCFVFKRVSASLLFRALGVENLILLFVESARFLMEEF